MIDLNKIGQRMKEQRKHIMNVSQERMAEELRMYQADISNMENAKSGSGISDLIKLDLIAEYLNIPLETLLFGREDKNMPIYHGNQMTIKKSKKKMPKSHREILLTLTGLDETAELSALTHICGPYTIYSMVEHQISIAGGGTAQFNLPKLHTFLFIGTELIGVMVADITTMMQHVFQPHLHMLQEMIPTGVLDVTDVYRTLNPYWIFWHFSSETEKEQWQKPMAKRMDALRERGEKRPVLYIESVYVREDCRRHGIFRMYIDLLKMLFDGCIMWLNMEPTSGNELKQEYNYIPTYSISELGQLNINAAIAEKIGFTVDPDTWHRRAETMDADGNISVEMMLVRKCAYYLPPQIRELLKEDGDLVAQGRAMQKVIQSTEKESNAASVDIYCEYKGEDLIAQVCTSDTLGETYYAAAILSKNGTVRYVVSYSDLLHDTRNLIQEEYTSLKDAKDSNYIDDLRLAETLLQMRNLSQGES